MANLTLELYGDDVQALYKDNKVETDKFISCQDDIRDRLSRNKPMTDDDMTKYVLTKDDLSLFEDFDNMAKGKEVKNFNLKDYLASPQAAILIPKIIVGAARRAAEPVYLASKFFKTVKAKNGQLNIFPVIGTMEAKELSEGQAPPIQGMDVELMQSNKFVTATKKGIRVQFTEQYLNDSQWDLVTYIMEEAGFAMARLKEQLACIEFSKRGWPVFDNSLRAIYPEAGTTGTDYDGALNDTMSIDDFLDLIIALMNNEKTPTDVLMHPLVWTVFARNGLTGALTGPTDSTSSIIKPNAQFPIGPQAVQGRLPFGLTINLSPFVPIDVTNKRFDLYCLDRNNVGVLLVQDTIKTEDFRDPITDIMNFKMIERYAYGTFDEGRGITLARGISMDKSYPMMERVKTFSP